ncbi:MAG: hypothetical protein IJZ93_01930 [Clostridia bacterium]|nr:hypothetical protein [Clostridia bacterium]
MKDNRTLSYINLFAILGAIPKLCQECDEARRLIENDEISIGFSVKNGPRATLIFDKGECKMVEGIEKCNIKLSFSKPEKFNGMIDGTVTPIPSKGFTKIGFLLKKFIPLTDLLSKYLRASEDDLKDEKFFKTSTLVMFYVITEAMSQIGNQDKVGMFSASNIVDGIARITIKGEESAYIVCDDHKLKTVHLHIDDYTSYMEFADINLARALFDGKVNAVSAVGLGNVRIGGMVSMVDNLNRILDRVSYYLA